MLYKITQNYYKYRQLLKIFFIPDKRLNDLLMQLMRLHMQDIEDTLNWYRDRLKAYLLGFL